MKKTLLIKILLVLFLASFVLAISDNEQRLKGLLQTHDIGIQVWGEYFPIQLQNPYLIIDKIKFGEYGNQVTISVENKTSRIINLDVNIAGFSKTSKTRGQMPLNLIGVGSNNGVALSNKERKKVNIQWRMDKRLIRNCEVFFLSVHYY
jgi:hypothetical protein